jgi:xylan 1,4-beta-xylosidase
MNSNIDYNYLPIRFDLHSKEVGKQHWHDDIELLYVFEGQVHIQIEQEAYELNTDDFIIINMNKQHRYKAEGKTLFGSFYIPYKVLNDLVQQNHIVFWCNSTLDKSTAYEEVRKIIREIIDLIYSRQVSPKIRLIGQCYNFLSLLVDNFLLTKNDTRDNSIISDDEIRSNKIIHFILQNYHKKITLTQLADELYLTDAYLSKYIKKHLGMNFLEYMNTIRLNHALEDLLYTDLSITQIAFNNGFSNISTFNKLFKDTYKLTPLKYKKHRQQEESDNESFIERRNEEDYRIQKYIQQNTNGVTNHNLATYKQTLEIKDLTGIEFQKSWKKMINIGTVIDVMKSNVREHMKQLKDGLRIEYFRVWDLYSPEMYIDLNSKNNYYNFDKLNRVLDFLVANNMKAYIELNIKPKKLISSINRVLIAEAPIMRFEDNKAVSRFMEALIMNLINRYGAEEVGKWYFELWNEELKPEGNMLENAQEYFSLFNSVAQSLKKYFPGVHIGGAGLSVRYGEKELSLFLQQWQGQEFRPDFLTFYCYPYIQGTYENTQINKMSTDRAYLMHYIENIYSIIHACNFEVKEVHISEWNSTISNRNVLNDGCYKGAYIVKNIIDTINTIDLLGYWFGTDIYSDYYDSNMLLNGSSGLLTKDGIAKPAYYAIQFMNRLGKKFVSKGDNYVLTETGFDEWRIVCHNYKFLNYKYFMMNEDEIEIQDSQLMFEDSEPQELTFHLKGMKKGTYELRFFSINQQYGSVQDEWVRMACPKDLSHEEINYLKQICVPRLSIKNISVDEEVLVFDTRLEANEIQLITIQYKYKSK